MKKRLFIGIPITAELQDSLSIGLTPLIDIYPDWRWVNKSNYHITVSFLGEVEIEEIPSLVKTLVDATRSVSAFSLRLTKLIFAPPQTISRMLWAINEENEQFLTLVETVENAVLKKRELPDFRRDQKAIAHITLARFDQDIVLLTDSALPILSYSVNISSLILFQSVQSAKGPSYSRLHEFDLA